MPKGSTGRPYNEPLERSWVRIPSALRRLESALEYELTLGWRLQRRGICIAIQLQIWL